MANLHCALLVVVALTLATAPSTAGADDWKTITFPSEDGLTVTADLYLKHKAEDAPMIVLFHQARWSRGEYREIAPRLNAMGFNCLAVDQRSGEGTNGVKNETAKRARAAGKGTTYVDALGDMRAALRYARKRTKGKVTAWGSSYSSALVLYLAGTSPKLADATLSFAPGEYFAKYGKSRTWIRGAAPTIKTPVFITSAKNEHNSWKAIYAAIPAGKKYSYLPSTKGNHGSRALYKRFDDSPGYWKEVATFLAAHAR